MSDQTEQAGGSADDRRAFLKKLAVGTAFAAPVVSSFSMSGVSAAYAQTPAVSGPQPAAPSSTTSSTTTTTMANANNPQLPPLVP
jgi:hypothetical protein